MDDKELDAIKREWLDGDRTEQSLDKICDKHNIMLDDFLYLDGYSDFESLIQDINQYRKDN